jgi:hypothetical protein
MVEQYNIILEHFRINTMEQMEHFFCSKKLTANHCLSMVEQMEQRNKQF